MKKQLSEFLDERVSSEWTTFRNRRLEFEARINRTEEVRTL